jgi:hypothetical protein
MVLASYQKIPLPRIDNPAADTRTFFRPSIDLFHIPAHVRKLFGSLQGDLLHSQMPDKSSGPRNEKFYMPLCHNKSMAPGGRPGLAPGNRIFRHWGMLKVAFRGPEDFSGIWECQSPCREATWLVITTTKKKLVTLVTNFC